MADPAPALVADLRRRIAAGWTLTLEGNAVVATDGHETFPQSLAIRCDTDADAAALLAAAQA